jgi:hypothetical protein
VLLLKLQAGLELANPSRSALNGRLFNRSAGCQPIAISIDTQGSAMERALLDHDGRKAVVQKAPISPNKDTF